MSASLRVRIAAVAIAVAAVACSGERPSTTASTIPPTELNDGSLVTAVACGPDNLVTFDAIKNQGNRPTVSGSTMGLSLQGGDPHSTAVLTNDGNGVIQTTGTQGSEVQSQRSTVIEGSTVRFEYTPNVSPQLGQRSAASEDELFSRTADGSTETALLFGVAGSEGSTGSLSVSRAPGGTGELLFDPPADGSGQLTVRVHGNKQFSMDSTTHKDGTVSAPFPNIPGAGAAFRFEQANAGSACIALIEHLPL